MNKLFYSLMSFIIALFFLMLGIYCLMIPWSASIRTNLVQFILEYSTTIFLFGIGFVTIGLAFIIHIAFSTKTHYYRLRFTGPNPIWIHESLIQDYLNTYWKHLFPKSVVPNRLTMKKNKIHLIADLPYIPLPEHKDLLERYKK